MIKKKFSAKLLAAALLLPLSLEVSAATIDQSAISLVRDLAVSMDENRDGTVSKGEYKTFTKLVHTSMDTDSNGQVNQAEFMALDAGFQWLAANRTAQGEASYVASKSAMFPALDLNGDGSISESELLKTAKAEFKKADRENSGRVTAIDILLGSETISKLAGAV